MAIFDKNRYFWLAALIWVSLDWGTKHFACENMQLGDSVELWRNVFHFTYAVNTGAAFSLFKNSVDVLKWISLLVSLVLASIAIWNSNLNRYEQLGYGSILGGAIGNGIDRFTKGYVVDFLDFRLIRFPIFNFADVAINLGLLCLLAAFFTGLSDRPNKTK
jgi:signal peptidase II